MGECMGHFDMKKIAYTERRVDAHGVTRVYGYTLEGKCYWLNLAECQRIYEAKGLKVLRGEV